MPLCICGLAKPTAISRRVLILQHPQEPDKVLGSATLAHRMLPSSRLVVGLSWPNLSAAWGEPVDQKRWGVLYLGSGPVFGDAVPGESKGSGVGSKSGPGAIPKSLSGVIAVDKKGRALDVDPLRLGRDLDGIVVLDGTWSQAKAIWWRNAWMLKLQRIVLVPRSVGLYGDLRREPRREAVSTIEAIAEVLEGIGESADQTALLKSAFRQHLDQFRASRASKAPAPIGRTAKPEPEPTS
ncbi:MAG: DTW domain-containing protein [Bdellovibrionales bacterium]|nr:DTW domain-containing protein [Bdellovibrionales bacterium]